MTGAKVKSSTVITDEVREILRGELRHGWTNERVATEMQHFGHTGWNGGIVNAVARGIRQSLTVDEAVALLAIFGGRAQFIETRIRRATDLIIRKSEQRGSFKREGPK